MLLAEILCTHKNQELSCQCQLYEKLVLVKCVSWSVLKWWHHYTSHKNNHFVKWRMCRKGRFPSTMQGPVPDGCCLPSLPLWIWSQSCLSMREFFSESTCLLTDVCPFRASTWPWKWQAVHTPVQTRLYVYAYVHMVCTCLNGYICIYYIEYQQRSQWCNYRNQVPGDDLFSPHRNPQKGEERQDTASWCA